MSWSLKRGKLTSRDRNYLGAFCKIPTFAGKRFFHSLPPSPLAPFFHSFPFLARQNYQNFLCSENPQKRLLRRLHAEHSTESVQTNTQEQHSESRFVSVCRNRTSPVGCCRQTYCFCTNHWQKVSAGHINRERKLKKETG